jgi:hypothetical protein
MSPLAAEPQPLAAQCRRALEQLDRLSTLQPREIQAEIEDISRTLAGLRDRMIDRLRRGADPAGDRHTLDRINVALSLVIGVGYPVTGVQRKHLENARSVMAEIARRELG